MGILANNNYGQWQISMSVSKSFQTGHLEWELQMV